MDCIASDTRHLRRKSVFNALRGNLCSAKTKAASDRDTLQHAS